MRTCDVCGRMRLVCGRLPMADIGAETATPGMRTSRCVRTLVRSDASRTSLYYAGRAVAHLALRRLPQRRLLAVDGRLEGHEAHVGSLQRRRRADRAERVQRAAGADAPGERVAGLLLLLGLLLAQLPDFAQVELQFRLTVLHLAPQEGRQARMQPLGAPHNQLLLQRHGLLRAPVLFRGHEAQG